MNNRINETKSLRDIKENNRLIKYYEKNKKKEWKDWLKLKQIFTHKSKQGITGILESTNNEFEYVFKLSRGIDNLINHENIVMNSLKSLQSYCPHFCRHVGVIFAQVSRKLKNNPNLFDSDPKNSRQTEVLLMEYLKGMTKLYNYFKSPNISDNIIYSAIKQTVIALIFAQTVCNFTHYDLHAKNIMMGKCDPDTVFVYVLDNDNIFCVPTYGYYPVIIDYGFSYANTMKDNYLYCTLEHTQCGFMCDRFDKYNDIRLFLVTVSADLYELKYNKNSKKLKRIVKNLFGKQKVDMNTGWDDREDNLSAMEHVEKIVNPYNMTRNNTKISKIFDEYSLHCLELIGSLIILPLQEQNYNDIATAYTAFLQEFVKIEEQLGHHFHVLHILKDIVEIARIVHADYIDSSKRHISVATFKQFVYDRVDKVASFVKLDNIHFEKMLCGLLCLARNMEGVLHDHMFVLETWKEKQYSKMPVKTLHQIYGILEVNFEDNYIFNKNSNIIFWDCNEKRKYSMKLLDTEISEINRTASISRGLELYRMLREKN